MGLVKIIGLVLLYIIIATFFFVIFAKDYIASNWGTYKCQPHIIPFASFFGYDTTDNFNKCMFQQSSSNNQVFMSPMFNITELMGGILGDLSQSVNSLRESNSETRDLLGTITGGFVNRISDLSSTLQFLFIKIRTLVERLFGVFTVLIYTALTTVELMTSVVNGPIGSMMSIFCFHGNMKIKMLDTNITKKISDIMLYDKISSGNDVISVMKFDNSGLNNKLFNYKNNTIVSGGHLVYNNGIWKRVKNVSEFDAKLASFETNEIYCITTKNNLIEINNNMFRDYIETSNDFINTHIKSTIIKCLNNEPYKENEFVMLNKNKIKNSPMNNYCISGFSKNTKLKLLTGYDVEISKLKLGDTLYDGAKVIGIIMHQNINTNTNNKSMCIVNNKKNTSTIVHEDTIIYYNNKWMLVKNIPNIKYIDDSEHKYNYDIIYNIVTTNNLLSINGNIYRDFAETNDTQINEYIETLIDEYLNKCV